MAIIQGYKPARIPEQQDFFQLPYNEMYKVLSDTQVKSDIMKGEAEALSTMSFSNLPDDQAGADAARTWLRTSVDKLAEDYGDDPRTWGAGLAKLKKEVAYRFDPTTGDIGKYQKRADIYSALQTQARETYKDNPLLADYAVSQIGITPFEGAQNDLVNFGISPAKMFRDVPEKEVTDWLDTNLKNIEAETLRDFGLAEYGDINEYTKAYISGDATGIPYQKVIDSLIGKIPSEYLWNYYQKARAAGYSDEEARSELNPTTVQEINGQQVAVPNPDNTLMRYITSGAAGKEFIKGNYSITFQENEVIKDQYKKAAEKVKTEKTFLPWETAAVNVEQAAPWGSSETDLNTFVTKMDQNNNTLAKGLLSDLNLDPYVIDSVTPEQLYNAERVVSTEPDGTTVTRYNIKNPDGSVQTIYASDGIMNDYRGRYEANNLQKQLAEEALLEAKTSAAKDAGYDVEAIDKAKQNLPNVQGYSKEDILKTVDAYLNVYGTAITEGKNNVKYVFKKKENGKVVDITAAEYNEIKDKYTSIKNLAGVDKYITTLKNDDSALAKYYRLIPDKIEAKSKLPTSGITTNDLGLDAEGQAKAQEDLKQFFDFGSASQFNAYVPGVGKPMTLQAALNQVLKNNKINPEEASTPEISGPITRTMYPTADGNFHWQVTYKVNTKNDGVRYLKALLPSTSGQSVSAPWLEQLDNSPEAKASEALMYAKNFRLNDFKIPGTDLTVRSTNEGDRVIVSIPGKQKRTLNTQEAFNELVNYYYIKEFMTQYNESYDEAKNRFEYFKNGTTPPEAPPVDASGEPIPDQTKVNTYTVED